MGRQSSQRMVRRAHRLQSRDDHWPRPTVRPAAGRLRRKSEPARHLQAFGSLLHRRAGLRGLAERPARSREGSRSRGRVDDLRQVHARRAEARSDVGRRVDRQPRDRWPQVVDRRFARRRLCDRIRSRHDGPERAEHRLSARRQQADRSRKRIQRLRRLGRALSYSRRQPAAPGADRQASPQPGAARNAHDVDRPQRRRDLCAQPSPTRQQSWPIL